MSKQEKNLLENKTIANEDISGDPQYFQYVGRNAGWVIMQYDVANGTYKYKAGKTDPTAGWTGRAGFTYQTPENL